jgi:hypothetical protein
VSSDVIAIVAGVIIAALIFWGGRAYQPRRSARFAAHPRRSIAPAGRPPAAGPEGAPAAPAPTDPHEPR